MFIAKSLGLDENHAYVLGRVQIERGRVLENALERSIKSQFHSTTAILLVPYVECASHYDTRRNLDTARKILQEVDDEVYTSIPRELSLRLVSTTIPAEAKQAIFRRLRSNSNNEPKVDLAVETQYFQAHKDVLCYWSPHFKALFQFNGFDRDNVSFSEDIISAVALKCVLDFAYSGVYDDRGSNVSAEERVNQLKDIQTAADYFLIDALKLQVKEILRSK